MDTVNFIINKFVTKEDEGKYLSVPLEVPKDIEHVSISYSYDKRENIIDFGLVNERGEFLGWSGSNRSQLEVSERFSSAGFAPCPVNAGTWNILLGAYKVKSGGHMVEYSITMRKKSLRLFKGDTHIHTTGSDGVLSTEQIFDMAKAMGMDFIFITDHNNYEHNNYLPSDDKLNVIPGVEWTHYNGHAGFLGKKRPMKNFVANSVEEARLLWHEAKLNGATMVLNHPFCPNCGWKWSFADAQYDIVEIFNGAVPLGVNLLCLEWWDNELSIGKKISGIGGSDFHRPELFSAIATPCTNVYAKSNSGSDILSALRKGNSFITFSNNAPSLDIDVEKDALPGEILFLGEDVKFNICGLKKDDIVKTITSGNADKLICQNDDVMQINKTMKTKGYMRIEVWRDVTMSGVLVPVLITNPFYWE